MHAQYGDPNHRSVKSATSLHLVFQVKGASVDLVPCLEASYAVHRLRGIDLRPSVTAVVVAPNFVSYPSLWYISYGNVRRMLRLTGQTLERRVFGFRNMKDRVKSAKP
jgi:hypothetical protein